MMKTTIFFHGDADGCCSAALILTALKTPARLVPILEPSDLERKARRHFGNALFLDLGTVTGKIVRRFSNAMVIDHHIGPRLPCVHINPTLDGKRAYPVSYLVYRMFGGPKRIALAGCIGDWFLPKAFYKPGGTIEDAYYKSGPGRIARAIDSTCALLGERGATLCVRSLLRGHVSGEMWRCLEIVSDEVDRAVECNLRTDGKLASLVFSSRHRIKSQVAQLLKVRYKNKIIFVGQSVGGNRLKFSLRESRKYVNLNSAVRESLKGLAGGGGGHFMAVGGWVVKKDFDDFFGRLKKRLNA